MRCRCVDASTSTPPHLCRFTSSHAHIRRCTSPHPRICTSISPLYIHTITPSHLSCLSFFLSFFLHIFSLASVHLHLRTLTSTDLPLHLHISTHLCRTCASTLSLLHVHPFFISLIYIFSTVLDNHMSRSRATSSSCSCLAFQPLFCPVLRCQGQPARSPPLPACRFRGRRSTWRFRGRRSTQSLPEQLRRAWSMLARGHLNRVDFVAGAALCEPGVQISWQAKYTEPPGPAGPAPGCLSCRLRGRRSTW